MNDRRREPGQAAGQTSGQISLVDIAAEAGVSVSTVSRIANGDLRRASATTVAKVQRLIAERGYRPNPVGRSLRGGDSRLVAMLAPNLDNPAMAAIAASTEAALRAAGYVMILCDTHDRPDLQDEYLRAMRSRFAEGFILVSAVASPELEASLDRREPIVFVNRRNPYGGGPFIGIDNRQAGADAADHLLACGVRSPAVIHPAELSSTIRERVEGFLDRIRERQPDMMVRRCDGAGANHLDCGYAAALRLAADGGWPDGVLCPSDLMAYGLFRAAGEQGTRIPEDCCPVGIDDNDLNAWIAPWLSSVKIPYHDFGAAIVASLRDLRAGTRVGEVLLHHKLVRRQSGPRG
nr:LacI family DNA-binding transcriptional regulator [uncultured Azospirillum sp.]